MNNKKIKKIISGNALKQISVYVLILSILLASAPGTGIFNAAGGAYAAGESGNGSDNYEGGQAIKEVPGALILDKAASPGKNTNESANNWEWEITLSLRGLDLVTTSDIVLLIDTSGSMSSNSKMTNAKAAANAFVDDLIKSDGRTRIAVVSFSEKATERCAFTTDAKTLKTAIGGLSANGGTNIQAGLKETYNILAKSNANKKYIVLLGDGEPTYSLKATNVGGVSLDKDKNFIYDANGKDFYMEFNDGSTGSGSSFTANISGVTISYDSKTSRVFPPDHGVSTVYQARLAKESGAEIYSVAVNAGTDGEKVLKSCSSGEEHYYRINSTNTDGLSTIFHQIAGKIAYAASDATVTDPMGEFFSLVYPDGADAADYINISQGTVSFDESNATIAWHIGDIREIDGTVVMKYTVRIDSITGATNPYEMYPTNKRTYVNYGDVNGKAAIKDFPIPKVGYPQIGSITIYAYILNEYGIPLNEQNIPAADRSEIFGVIEIPAVNPEPPVNAKDNTVFAYGSYKITADPIISVNGEHYAFVNGDAGNLGDESPAWVTVDVHNQSARVYFAYEIRTSKVTYDLNGGSGNFTDDKNYRDGEAAVVKQGAPVKPHYTFGGWEYNGKIYKSGDEITMTGDVLLTAVWNANRYAVRFDANGGEGSMGDQLFEYNVSQALSMNLFERAGYEFIGWGMTTANEIEFYDMQVVNNLTDENGAVVTLYAAWTPANNIGYTVRYLLADSNIRLADDKKISDQTMDCTIVEHAIDIPGYSPDADTKSITLKTGGNYITFYYGYTGEDIEITALGATKDYDGKPLTQEKYDVSELPYGITHVTAVTKGEQTAPGSSENIIESYVVWNGEIDVTEYYSRYVRLETGLLTVNDTVKIIEPSPSPSPLPKPSPSPSANPNQNTDDGNKDKNAETIATPAADTNTTLRNREIPGGAIEPFAQRDAQPSEADMTEKSGPLAGFIPDHIQYINGYPDGTVRPEAAITRAEVSAILFRLLVDPAKNNKFDSKFNDVDDGAWYAQSVKYLASIGIIKGYEDGGFRPDNAITRAEFATLISGFDNLEESVGNKFNDVNGHWAAGYINSAAEKGWVAGYPDGSFKPENFLTREEVVTVVNRMLLRAVELGDIPDWAPTYTDISEGHWSYAQIIEASCGHEFERKEGGNGIFEIWTGKLTFIPVLES